MPLSTFTSVATIAERSEATPGLFNRIFSIVSQNVDQLNIDALSTLTGVSTNTLRPESGSTVRFLPIATYVVQRSIDSGGQLFDVRAYNAVGDGATDNTTAFQNCLSDAVTLGGAMYVGPGRWRCGTITDSSGSQLMILGSSGATIESTGTIWLRVQPAAAKYGVILRDLRFAPASGTTVMSPQILIRGTASGGVTELDIDHLTFHASNQLFDCIHLSGSFNGRVSNLFGTSLYSSRGLLVEGGALNSGNLHLDTIQLEGCGMPLGLSDNFNIVAGSSLLNQIVVTNHKATATSFFNDVTLTASVATSTSTLSLSAADVSSINTGDWAVCADVNTFSDVVRIRSKLSSTMVQLERALPSALASGATIGVGTFGAVVGGNTRGVHFDTAHAEDVGAGIYCVGSQQVQIDNLIIGGNVRRGVICTHGAQGTKVRYPIYSLSLTTAVLMEVTASGTNTNNLLLEPAGYSSGAGPASFLSDGQAETNNNRYLPTPDVTARLAIGSAVAPSLAINSELSLGLYRSVASTLALSYGTLRLPSDLSVGRNVWSSGSFIGSMLSLTMPTADRTFTGTNWVRFEPNTASATNVGWTFFTDASAVGSGLHQSWGALNASSVVVEYARTGILIQVATAGAHGGAYLIQTAQGGTITEVTRFNQLGQQAQVAGSAVAPSYAFQSENSLGLYRSGVSTLALSYGSFNLNQARTVSMRTLAASSLTPSAANTNTAANECGFTIGGASGASFWINSGGTTYIFNSAISAANA